MNLFPCLREWVPLKFLDKIKLLQFLHESNQMSLLTKIQLIWYSLGQTKPSEEEKEENSEANKHLMWLKQYAITKTKLLQYISMYLLMEYLRRGSKFSKAILGFWL